MIIGFTFFLCGWVDLPEMGLMVAFCAWFSTNVIRRFYIGSLGFPVRYHSTWRRLSAEMPMIRGEWVCSTWVFCPAFLLLYDVLEILENGV